MGTEYRKSVSKEHIAKSCRSNAAQFECPLWVMCGRRLGKNFLTLRSIGRVRSCVRPARWFAPHGPDLGGRIKGATLITAGSAPQTVSIRRDVDSNTSRVRHGELQNAITLCWTRDSSSHGDNLSASLRSVGLSLCSAGQIRARQAAGFKTRLGHRASWLRISLANQRLSNLVHYSKSVNAAATDINIAKASRYRPRRRHHGGNCCIVPLRRVYIATNALPANSRGSLSTASKLHCDYWRSAFGNSLRCGSLISLRNQSVSSTRSAPTATYQCGYRKLKTTCQMTTGGHLNVPCASVLQSEL